MIEDLDEALRQLLIREIPIKNGEVDVKFDQPKREWSSRLSRPALNLFLYDVRENIKLRQGQPTWEVERNKEGVIQRRKPVRVDLYYMVTVWAADPEDEHRLLARTLMALFRHPHLPADLLPESLQGQPVPIPVVVAQREEFQNPADVWSALDNELRPTIICVVTLALDPYQPLVSALVRTRELRIGPSPVPPSQQLEKQAEELFWSIGGTVRTDQPLEKVRLTLVEQDRGVTLREGGRFTIGRLKAGDYTLEVTVEGREPVRHKITVPSPDYEIKIE
jgi:hypothetical protein